MKLTKKLAVALHRRLWNWIADETERQQRKVQKIEYPPFKHFKIHNDCWCCKYARTARKNDIVKKAQIKISICPYCPINWGSYHCLRSEYGEWDFAATWQEAAHCARIIAELPERNEETKE